MSTAEETVVGTLPRESGNVEVVVRTYARGGGRREARVVVLRIDPGGVKAPYQFTFMPHEIAQAAALMSAAARVVQKEK